MTLWAFLTWAFLMGPIPHAFSLSPSSIKDAAAKPPITVLESKFILMDYGLFLEPRKLNKREHLALALTNWLDDRQ